MVSEGLPQLGGGKVQKPSEPSWPLGASVSCVTGLFRRGSKSGERGCSSPGE